jgi:two-component system chemotaxis response regulator CheB
VTIRLVVVADSRFVREALTRVMADEPDIAVVGTADTGEEFLARLDEWRPDVVTLDLVMPGMGGLAALDRLMAVRPTPVIILSSQAGEGAPLTLEALSRGAADFIDKEAHRLVDFQALRAVLLAKIRSLAAPRPDETAAPPPMGAATGAGPAVAVGRGPLALIAIGASTGGPGAIEQILRTLGTRPTVPIAIVQHMPPGFTAAFAERLDRHLPFPVREALDGAPLESGTIHIAPAGLHLRADRRANGVAARLDSHPTTAAHRPSVDVLFSSVAAAVGERSVAVLLTGMGRDGAEGMAALARAGGRTIAQSAATCIVYGMPRAAVELGAAREVLPLGAIGPRLGELMAANAAAG